MRQFREVYALVIPEDQEKERLNDIVKQYYDTRQFTKRGMSQYMQDFNAICIALELDQDFLSMILEALHLDRFDAYVEECIQVLLCRHDVRNKESFMVTRIKQLCAMNLSITILKEAIKTSFPDGSWQRLESYPDEPCTRYINAVCFDSTVDYKHTDDVHRLGYVMATYLSSLREVWSCVKVLRQQRFFIHCDKEVKRALPVIFPPRKLAFDDQAVTPA